MSDRPEVKELTEREQAIFDDAVQTAKKLTSNRLTSCVCGHVRDWHASDGWCTGRGCNCAQYEVTIPRSEVITLMTTFASDEARFICDGQTSAQLDEAAEACLKEMGY